MPEYIEREALLNEARKRAKAFSVALIYEAIKEAPVANVVEVVKCKDCAHAVKHKYSPAFFKCNGCHFLKGRLVNSTFWCKCGERSSK